MTSIGSVMPAIATGEDARAPRKALQARSRPPVPRMNAVGSTSVRSPRAWWIQ